MEWTAERIEILTTLWTDGNTASELSRRLGVTRNAVIGKVHRLGLGGRQAPKAPRAIAVRTPRRTRTPYSWPGVSTPLPPLQPRLRPYVVASDFAPTANLLTLEVHSCRWPIGNPSDPEFGFCGRDRQNNVSYCDDHRKIALRRSSFSEGYVKRLAGIR